MKVDVVQCGPAVNESERKAINQIKTRLIGASGDDQWWLLTNLAFSATHRLQSDEIDIVAIGPAGVQVIEVKHWTAAWVNRNPGIVEQEADKLTNKARKIGTTLRRLCSNLPRVDGAFLVTETAAKVKALERREPVRGVPFYTFKTWRGAVGLGSGNRIPVLSPKQRRALAAQLKPEYAIGPDGVMKRLAGYTRLQLLTPPGERFHRIYKATHATRQDRAVLHLYDLSANEGSKAEEKAAREWKILHRLQQYGWAPRIVDSFQDVPGYTDEIKFFTVADPAAPNIRERTTDISWDTSARLNFARRTVRALRELHESGVGGAPVLHRNLSLRTILVKHDNSPILTGFEYARVPKETTVASAESGEEWDPETPPEIRAQGRVAADRLSDTYSVCASLRVMFEGRNDDLSLKAADVLTEGMAESPGERKHLPDLEASLSKLAGKPGAEPPPPPARFWTEDQVIPFRGQEYRIVSRLGSGGVGTTYKVVKVDPASQGDLGTYVAKVARDEKTGKRILKAYALVHSHLRHSALSTIFEVAPEWQDNGFVALMTWIEGSPLGEYAGVVPILADDLHEVSGEALMLRWLRTACEALAVLHENGLVHGDLSPRNMIVSGTDLVLTDYDCVTKIGTRAATPGTVLYCAPFCLEGKLATPSDDIYALATSFFHVLFDREPFRDEGDQAKARGLDWDAAQRSEHPLVAPFLDRATDPNPKNRFATTAEALVALNAARGVESPGRRAVHGRVVDSAKVAVSTSKYPGDGRIERRENEVPWLKSLLRSYPGSRRGNSETRGLDSDFALDTYVETNLDQALYDDIVDRRVNLVILCGNAGDGKTALLQHLAQKLGLGNQPSATRIVKGRSHNGLSVRMNLDGSASWNGRSADRLLNEFLAPFQHGRPTDEVVHLLAINDGRLLEWIENVEDRQGETPLTKDLNDFLEKGSATQDSHIRFINLNKRSLVGSVSTNATSIDTDFLHRLVDSLYGGEDAAATWAPCETCLAQERCEVYRATRIFGPGKLAREDGLREHARKRLFHALQAVHIRGETHITVRELRSALVYVLFGIQYCDDYHELDPRKVEMPDPQTYAERAFSSESCERQGQVLRELVRFDPALDAHPRIDRLLLHPRSIDDTGSLPRYDGLPLEAARRRAYFEWPEGEVERFAGNPHALDLAQGSHLREFLALATNHDADQRHELRRRLCAGISRLETLPPKALERNDAVPLQITPRTPTETAFWVEKSVDRFRLEVDSSNSGAGIDRLHRQAFLVYSCRDGREERLRLGADLFHLLLELSDGYQLGDVATDDAFAHLSIFVQRLVQEDYHRMFAWNPMREDVIFEVSANVDAAGTDTRQRIVIAQVELLGESNAE